jgi:indolepyruvate ferredoxin oxidoreductase
MQSQVEEACGEGNALFLDTQQLATRLMGDALYGNLFLLGLAWQKGMVPLSLAAIDKSIELNGAAVEQNRKAFLWGRRAAHDPLAVRRCAEPATVLPMHRFSRSLEETIKRRVDTLTVYQDAAYARHYQSLVDRVRAAESALQSTGLSEAVARNYFKLLAIKDEYEVARLYTDPVFMQQLNEAFEGDFSLRFSLAPPLLAKPDPATGRIAKRSYGPWMMSGFKLLARLKGLRGTPFDVFGYSAERRMERQLIADYEADIELILGQLNSATLDDAIELAKLPEQIRGFGHVKAASVTLTRSKRDTLRQLLKNVTAAAPARAAA